MNIYDFVNSYKIDNRDKLVKQVIQDFYQSNLDGMKDGLYKDFLTVGKSMNTKLMEIYNINKQDLNQFKKTNKVLSQDMQITNDFAKVCLLTSFFDTKDRFFADFIFIMYSGSKLSYFFPYRDSITYEAKMRHAVAFGLNGNSFIKKEGTMYSAMVKLSTHMFDKKDAANKVFDKLNVKDDAYPYILGRIRTSVTSTIKTLKNSFEQTRMDDKAMSLSRDITVQTKDGESRLEGDTNSTFITTLKYTISNYNPKLYDYEVFRVVGLTHPEYKFAAVKLLQDEKNDWFRRVANIYLDYYLKNHYVNRAKFEKDFIHKAVSGRLNSSTMVKLNDDMMKKLLTFKDDYMEVYPDADIEVFNRIRNIDPLIKKFKNYVIVKIKKLCNGI